MTSCEQWARPGSKPETAETRQKASPLVGIIRTAEHQATFPAKGDRQTPGSSGFGCDARSAVGARHIRGSRGLSAVLRLIQFRSREFFPSPGGCPTVVQLHNFLCVMLLRRQEPQAWLAIL